jgi:RimJ/RimL family protein N-acetyltransferase
MISAAVTLIGHVVRLEPLTMEHHAGLCEVGLDPELWRWTTAQVRTPEDMRKYIETALLWREQGTAIPIATIEETSCHIVVSTRFMNIDAANRRAEIGSTWIARPWQRTSVNTEAKLLMLQHAFETLGFLRVELKTDSLNERSRNAILRIGAKEEGTFRNHMVCEDGRIRHSVYYSIIDSEWPTVKAALRQKLRIQ